IAPTPGIRPRRNARPGEVCTGAASGLATALPTGAVYGFKGTCSGQKMVPSAGLVHRAECPAAHPAIGDGRRIRMEITVHFVLPFEPLPEGCGSVLLKPDSLPPDCGVCSSDACSCSSLSRLSI